MANPKIIKTTIAIKSKKLSAKWTIEEAQDLLAVHSSRTEQEIMDILGEEIQMETDWEVLKVLVDTSNWVTVNFHSNKDAYTASRNGTMKTWLKENCAGPHHKLSTTVVFSNAADAEFFMLRWM